ncbi:MAG TPA: copper-binding protein [Gallionella sp.]|nr:copper-binding protein [Gallionella sp.]
MDLNKTSTTLGGIRIVGMLRTLLLCTSLVLMSGSAMAEQFKHGATQGSTSSMQLTDAVVKKIDRKHAKVTLQHGDIPDVMPAMTMAYRLKDARLMDGLHVGDSVRFALEKSGDDYIVTHLEVAR